MAGGHYMYNLLLLICTVNGLDAARLSVKQRLSVMENKLNSIEIFTSTFQDSLAEINSTMFAVCALDERGDHVTSSERQRMRSEPSYDSRELTTRLTQAFQEEKQYARKREQRITQTTNAFLQLITEKINKTSALTDDMDQRLNKANTEIAQLFDSTARLKVTVDAQTSTLADHLETRLKSAEDEIANLKQTSHVLITAVNSLNHSLFETSGALTEAVNSLNQSLLTLFNKVDKLDDVKKGTESLQNPTPRQGDTLTTHAAPQCLSSWERFGTFCYKYFASFKTYAGAREICASHNAHVVDVDTQEEMTFVMSLIPSRKSINIWLGLTDSVAEGTWRWERTNAVASFLNWRPGQPDAPHYNQDCVTTGYGQPHGQWYDWPCSHPNRFVCKRSLV